jgi:predicted nucleotidyltransferase
MNIMDRQQVIDEAVRRLVEYFRPERIYLFGSTARGEASPDSDLDFLVVVPDETPSRRFWDVYKETAGLDIPVDVKVIRRRDFEARRDWLMSLAAIALREGKVLYDAHAEAA